MTLPKPHVVALRWPRGTLLAWLILLLACGFGLSKLRIRTDGFALLPKDVPEVLHDAGVRETFGLRDRIIVIVEAKSKGGIFQTGALSLIARLTSDLAGIPGIGSDNVVSLATEPNGHLRVGASRFPALLDPVPRSEGEVEQARADAAALKVYDGTLLSMQAGTPGQVSPCPATAILIGVPPTGDRKELCVVVERIANRAKSADFDIHVVGGPVAETLLGEYVVDDLRTFLPLTALVIGVLFLWLFRSPRLLLAVYAEIGAALVLTFGLMGHLGTPVTIAAAVLPMVIIPVIVADEVHIFSSLCRVCSRGAQPRSMVLREVFDECWMPVARTGATTALAGVVFAISPVDAIRDFGLFLGFASFICTIWTLTATPAILVLGRASNSPWTRQPRAAVRASSVGWTTRHPRIVLAIVIGLPAVPIALGLAKSRIQDSWTSGFGKETSFRRSMEKVDAMFDGTQLLHVVFDTRPGAFPETGKWSELRSLETPRDSRNDLTLLLKQPGEAAPQAYVGKRGIVYTLPGDSRAEADEGQAPSGTPVGSVSVTSAVKGAGGMTLELALDGALPIAAKPAGTSLDPQQSPRTIVITGERILDPETLSALADFEAFLGKAIGSEGGGLLGAHEQIGTVRFMVHGMSANSRSHGVSASENADLFKLLEAGRGESRFREIVDREMQQVLITIFLRDANYQGVKELMRKISTYEQVHLSPRGIQLGYAGDVWLSQSLIRAVTSSELLSIAGSLAAMFLLISIMEGSVRIGILASIPSLLAILVNLSLLGWLDTPIGVATSMFAGVIFGIGVDSSIHFFDHLRKQSPSDPDAVRNALSHIYPAIVCETLVLSCGFSILIASPVPANRNLGILLAGGILSCSLFTVFVLPSICSLSTMYPYPLRRKSSQQS